jgi:adenylate cyclase
MIKQLFPAGVHVDVWQQGSNSAMAAYLTFSTEGNQHSVPCTVVTTIGRDKNNAIVLSDLQVSRHHAMVRRLGTDDYYLIDSGSANGSKLDNRRITTPTLLRDGACISIGTTQFRFEQPTQQHSLHDSLSLQETVVVHAPQIREITILVADMRGFTSLSEQLPIQMLTRLMSDWFEAVSACIAAHGGAVDKFIGDCVFARWDGDDIKADVFSALRTACAVNEITGKLAATLPACQDSVRIGAGINVGQAALGIGSENTALGDAVNTAFRLESATKELGVDIVLSQSAYCHLPTSAWHDRERSIKVKGKRERVQMAGFDFDGVKGLLTNAG